MPTEGSLRELFEELLAAPAEERQALLARVPDVRDRVRLAAMVTAEEDMVEGADIDAERAFPWPGDHVGGYRLVAPVGAGGMGAVWAAESRRTPGIRVAVKFASAAHVGAEEARLRLEQERRILMHLDHPGVARLIDAGEAGPKGGFLVLVFVGGRTFDEYARGVGIQMFVRAVGELSRTLDHVHSQGVVHRDLKPSNVLVDERGWPTVIDFGTARVMETSALTSRHVTQGVAPHTPAFASPEQESGRPVSARTDVFGLAKLVEACCESAAIEVDVTLRAILDRACADDPARRHASTGELGAALEEWAAPGSDRTTWAASVPVRIGLGAGLLGIGAALPLWLGGQGPAGFVDGVHGGALTVEFFEALAETPVDSLPRQQDTFERLAEDDPGRGWEVAAGWIALETGRVEDARGWAIQAREVLRDLPAQRLTELGELNARLGFLEGAAAALEEAGGRTSEEDEALEFLALELRYRSRSGAIVDWNGLDDLVINAASVAQSRDLPFDAFMKGPLDEEREDEVLGLVHELALETGQISSLGHWLEEVERERRVSPLEEPSRFLYGLLSVHARLVMSGDAVPLEEDLLEELDEKLRERWVEHGDALAIRAWGLVRASRLIALLGEEDDEVAEEARWLAEESRVLLEDELAGPVDLTSTFLALEASAAARADDDGESNELWDRALDAAANVGEAFHGRMSRARGTNPALHWIVDPWGHLPTEGTESWLRAVSDLMDEMKGAAPWWRREP